jgi:flagellin
MSLRINHNASAMRTLMAGYQINRDLSQSLERLSSGLRINRASDDAASLSISENLRAQIRGSHQAIRNAQDFVSLVQIAEGALGEVTQLLQRIRELAVQAANGTLDTSDRASIQAEVTQAVAEVTRITGDTTFNSKNLLDGTFTNQTAQVGADYGETLTLSIDETTAVSLGISAPPGVTAATTLSSLGVTAGDFRMHLFAGGGVYLGTTTVTITAGSTLGSLMSDIAATSGGHTTATLSSNVVTIATANPFHGWAVDNGSTTTNLAAVLGIGAATANSNTKSTAVLAAGGGGISVTTLNNAQQTISTVDEALSMVSSQRALLGATQNRLEHTMRSQMIAAENMAAANSRLRDLDFADEITNLTRHQILAQSSTAILAQSNVSSAGMLDLLS